MTLVQFCSLLVVYLVSLAFVLLIIYREFQRIKFNFNIFFSVLYLITFYLGCPFTCLLMFYYEVKVVPVENLLESLLAATAFYGIYHVSYKTRLFARLHGPQMPWLRICRTEIHLLWLLMALIAVTAVMMFFIHNGFLLFRLHSYRQIFSSDVSSVALKRFFYFFIPAMLLIYFLNPTRRSWILLLITTVVFGIFTYIVVGGTRANIIIAFALFLCIGMQRGWITLWMLALAGVMVIVGMFWLALKRYGMNVSGNEAFYAFLYLTRDTFSPWENLALLLQNYGRIDFQGLAPIVRDFYVFIPKWLWPDRPSLVMNTANYFTYEVLKNYSGLAISPTLIGSFIVMGGVSCIPHGAIVIGLIIKWFDTIYERGTTACDCYRASLLQSFCFGAIFNMIVLAREGLDAFVSRIVFFCLVFSMCLFLAKLLFLLCRYAGIIRPRYDRLNYYYSMSSQSIPHGKNIMVDNDGIPHYQIRGLTLCGFRDRSEFVEYLFAGGRLKTGIMVAINAEKVLSAERDSVLKQLLDEAEYKYADGISIVRSIRRKYHHTAVSRIAGADLWEDLMERAGREGVPVFLVGGYPFVLMQTEVQLRTRWRVNIVGRQDGYFPIAVQPALIEGIRDSGAAIVIVAMGSPRQEQLMQACRWVHPEALYMGVGGAYDVFTGHVKRAPKVWQNLGLEWFYRLLRQPWRLSRQFKLLRYLGYYISERL